MRRYDLGRAAWHVGAQRARRWWAGVWMGLLLQPAAGAPPERPATVSHAYEARLAQRSLAGGHFSIGAQRWACMGTLLRCHGELDLAEPSVAACRALARRTGAVAAFGRVDGAWLKPAELVACNLHAREQPPKPPESGSPR